MTQSFEEKAKELLSLANICVNGSQPRDIQVHNTDLYARVLSKGSIGLGESYMDGWWDCKNLDQFFYKLISSKLDEKVTASSLVFHILKSKVSNQQKKSKAFHIGEKHYDLGNDLYQFMLDKRMAYTCGYWKDASTLDQAQEAKLDLVCKKLNLKKGDKILDIGCGWGSFMKYASEKYKVSCVGITVSKEQIELGKKLCKGLPIEFKLIDYRDLMASKYKDKFDHVVSLGMFEHVGYKNYEKYMKIVHHVMKDDGLFLLHTIGGNISRVTSDQWISKYIFPNSMLPSITQIASSIEKIFIIEDLHNFGADYDKTLMAWYHNFDKNWKELERTGLYDERFKRMWKYYLLSCAGLFRVRKTQLWQIVLSKNGVKDGYISVR
ncbi:cyclopropane-fatty-acyl-phospholipid synthase [Candidatus Pacearchaeota archaeon CG10_big_fil_rev_8_21_14_0_10_32_14]|nr:MAG: cyclopropane-fatty-acyl-phospholipid synthase [Candidatus Pacearchaeota archaeon CG10_big_fil_rev_8_21_14_0_10_32_14]